MYNRLALLRTEAGMSRKALAEAVEVNPQTIGFLERGDYRPSLELGMRLAAVFGVSVEQLFSFTPFPTVIDLITRAGE